MNHSPKIQVLCFSPYPPKGPSFRHRVLTYAPYWKEKDVELTCFCFMTDHLYQVRRQFGTLAFLKKAFLFLFCTLRLLIRMCCVKSFDVIVIHREIFPLGKPYCERWVSWMNPRVFYDVDDAIWHRPSFSVNQRKWFWDERRVEAVMRHSHCVVVGNRYLAEYASRFNSQVHLIPTVYKDLLPENKKTPHSETPVRLIWIGNLGNAGYLRELMPTLERLSEKHTFKLYLLGGEDIFELKSDRFSIDARLWTEALEEQLLLEADIGLMPLFDADYEKGKCAFKLVQYYSAGLAVVASPVGMNQEVVSHGINGYLAKTPKEWETALEDLISNPKKRLQAGLESRKLYSSQFTIPQHAERWLKLFEIVRLK